VAVRSHRKRCVALRGAAYHVIIFAATRRNMSASCRVHVHLRVHDARQRAAPLVRSTQCFSRRIRCVASLHGAARYGAVYAMRRTTTHPMWTLPALPTRLISPARRMYTMPWCDMACRAAPDPVWKDLYDGTSNSTGGNSSPRVHSFHNGSSSKTTVIWGGIH